MTQKTSSKFLDYRKWWDCNLDFVPYRTGAATIMDCSDLLHVWHELGVTIKGKRVLDVGCGTGRVGDHCDHYHGLDVAPAMVAATRARGHKANLIRVMEDVEKYKPYRPDIIICSSVFTHIPHDHQKRFLRSFHRVARECVVDIIPGDGTGEIAYWTAVVPDFEGLLVEEGWRTLGVYDNPSPDAVPHRYYHIVRA